jgi:hypothetical protein
MSGNSRRTFASSAFQPANHGSAGGVKSVVGPPKWSESKSPDSVSTWNIYDIPCAFNEKFVPVAVIAVAISSYLNSQCTSTYHSALQPHPPAASKREIRSRWPFLKNTGLHNIVTAAFGFPIYVNNPSALTASTASSYNATKVHLARHKMRGKWRKAGVDKQKQARRDVTEDLCLDWLRIHFCKGLVTGQNSRLAGRKWRTWRSAPQRCSF